MYYEVSPEIFAKLPNACFGAVAVRGLDNTKPVPELSAMLQENIAACEKYFEGKKPKETPDIVPYREAFRELGINPEDHDIRLVEDNWESPTLGAWGLGWEVWLDGMEITQFTYFQQVGSIDCKPVTVEITYGLERLAMYIQGVENVYDVQWVGDYTYGDVFHTNEVEQSYYNFQIADTDLLFDLFEKYEKEAKRVIELGYIRPAYDYVLKCSHTFNLLDSRGAISVSERTAYIGRVRAMARLCANAYVKQREELDFPLNKKGGNK